MRASRLGVTLGLVIASLSGRANAEVQPTVKTAQGLVEGIAEEDALVFKGVPFARPPVGELRWRPPQDPMNWRGTLRANKFKPMCMTKWPAIPGFPMEPVSEDCLYLNIWAPKASDKAKLPVMIFFSGGGQRTGSASNKVYWGDELVKKGVIVVNVSSRVGALGFLSHPDLSRESGYGASGNYGVMDMIAALRWVKRNISGFGGDPRRVTIFGQSSGSMAVGYMMTTPLAKGLFARAIGQSNADMTPPGEGGGLMLRQDAEASGLRWAASLGAKSIADLRQLPADKLVAADDQWPEGPNGLVKGGGREGVIAVLDGHVFPKSMHDTFLAGSQNDVPILVGFNANEAGYRIPSPLKAREYRLSLEKDYGAAASRVLAAYPGETDAEALRSQFDLARDSVFAWPVWRWASLQSQRGSKSAYLYRFSYETPFPDARVRSQGAAHGYELGYVFGHPRTFGFPATAEMLRMSDVITSFWTNFAKSGDPNGAGLPKWPKFDLRQQKIMELDGPSSARSLTKEETERFETLSESLFNSLAE